MSSSQMSSQMSSPNQYTAQLIDYIDDKSISTTSQTQTETDKINYKTYKADDVENMSEGGIKLSNQEKNIIKRIREKS